MKPAKEKVLSKRRRTRYSKESSGAGSINDMDEEGDDEEENMSAVGDDEDDIEEVLGENIEMDMEDTGKAKQL